MSRILHLVNMSHRYRGSKGVRELQLEEHPWTSLAAPCHLEESASHHILLNFCIKPGAQCTRSGRPGPL